MSWDIARTFRLHASALRNFLRKRGFSTDVAEDLSQETFLRLLTAQPQGPFGNERAYLFRVGRNLAVDFARRERVVQWSTDSEAILARKVDDAPSVERIVISRQELRLLQAALDELPEPVRQVFFARLEGLTFADIGQKLNVSPNTAFSQMAKALLFLRQRLETGQ